MRNFKIICISFFAAILSANPAFAALGRQSPPQQSMYFAGPSASLCIRKGAYEFEDIGLRQDTARNNMIIIGGSLGKRYVLTENLRLNAAFSIGFGNVLEDTLYLNSTNINGLVIKNSLFHFDFSPEFQMLLPGTQELDVKPYIFAGGGINFVKFKEVFLNIDDLSQQVKFSQDSDMEPMEHKRWCPHINAGIGFDFIRRRDIGIGLRYNFKYWVPVKYEDGRDFPVETITYRERFLSHSLAVQILFAIE